MIDSNLKKYSRNLAFDLSASIVVFLVALPLCLGIAVASKAPPLAGLVAGIVGGIVVGVISGSHVSVSGPAAGLTIIVAGAITSSPSYEAFLCAVVLAGVFQVLFGALKAGKIGEYIPSPVIKGMLAAIGLILVLKQIPHLLGHDTVPEGDEEFLQPDGHNTFSELFNIADDLSMSALIIGLVSMAILLLWELSFFKKTPLLKLVPGSLVVVLVGVFLHEYLSSVHPEWALSSNHLVNIPVTTTNAEFLGLIRTPDWSFLFHGKVLLAAITIGIVASLESLLSIEASDKIDPQKRFTPPNRELIAQGTGNVVSGILGGLPVTAVIVRSSANVSSGAQTKTSAILHGFLLLVCVYAFPALLNRIPLSALAAVLILVGYKLTKPSIFKELYKKGGNQFLPFIVTIIAILFTDLLIGILIGIIAGLYFIIKSNYESALIMVQDEDRYLIKFKRSVSFLNRPVLKKMLSSVPPKSKLLIDTSRTEFLDADVEELITDFLEQAKYKKISVELKERDE